jgi:hypothetical protein
VLHAVLDDDTPAAVELVGELLDDTDRDVAKRLVAGMIHGEIQ